MTVAYMGNEGYSIDLFCDHPGCFADFQESHPNRRLCIKAARRAGWSCTAKVGGRARCHGHRKVRAKK
jgi:hypothetical protein